MSQRTIYICDICKKEDSSARAFELEHLARVEIIRARHVKSELQAHVCSMECAKKFITEIAFEFMPAKCGDPQAFIDYGSEPSPGARKSDS